MKVFKAIKDYFVSRPKHIKQAYSDAKLMYSLMYASNKAKMDKMLGIKKNEED